MKHWFWVKFRHSGEWQIARKLQDKDWEGKPMEYWMICGCEEEIAPEELEEVGEELTHA